MCADPWSPGIVAVAWRPAIAMSGDQTNIPNITNSLESGSAAGGVVADGTGNDHLMAAVFAQAWENMRHIRNERIWFGNI